MAKAPLKSIHPLDMADALTAQNEAVAMLVAACRAAISVGGMAEPAQKALERATRDVYAVFWGMDES